MKLFLMLFLIFLPQLMGSFEMNAQYIHHQDSHPVKDNYMMLTQKMIFASVELHEKIMKLLQLGRWKIYDDTEGLLQQKPYCIVELRMEQQ
jgi:hypothetical protein